MKDSASILPRRPQKTGAPSWALACLMLFGWCSGAPAADQIFGAFDDILLQNVRNGFVDYDGIAADPRFEQFVAQIGAGSPDLTEGPDNGLAFYINTYNALSIQGILNGLSPETIWSRRKFFKRQKFLVLGDSISLEALEHERIIPLGDPRIHFAIVCASMSCPRLSSRAYLPDKINIQLHDAAQAFINDFTLNRFDLEHRVAYLSKIFDWYADDFAQAGGSLQRYLARFMVDAEVQEALRAEEFEIRYTEYDWSLNGYFSGSSQ